MVSEPERNLSVRGYFNDNHLFPPRDISHVRCNKIKFLFDISLASAKIMINRAGVCAADIMERVCVRLIFVVICR